MTVDFSQDIKTTRRQIESYVRRGQKIPKDVLYYHNSLLSASINTDTVENGQADDFPGGSLSQNFLDISTSNNTITTGSPTREYILIQNIGGENIYVYFGPGAASVGAGLLIVPGGSWSTQFPQFTRNSIQVIAENNSSRIAFYYIG